MPLEKPAQEGEPKLPENCQFISINFNDKKTGGICSFDYRDRDGSYEINVVWKPADQNLQELFYNSGKVKLSPEDEDLIIQFAKYKFTSERNN